MASLTIRNLDDELKSQLRQQAARHGCSMEQEARDILRRAVQTQSRGAEFALKIHQRFAKLKAEELPIRQRRTAIALAHDLPLATRNSKDFKGIEGLTVLDPWA